MAQCRWKAQGAIELQSAATAGAQLGQGATRSRSGATYCSLLGQGATEYLVLLAVVLIVALVSVALLGFFPGMASDSQITQSQVYWQSASPISITESSAFFDFGYANPYMRLRNTASYPIRITRVLVGSGSFNQFWSGGCMNFSDYFYLAPGEEKSIGQVASVRLDISTASPTPDMCQWGGGASLICRNVTGNQGSVILNNFGFEYIAYVEGQQLTKRQIGSKPLIIKCTG